MKQDKRTGATLDFGCIQKEIQKVRERLERKHGPRGRGGSLPHRAQS